MPIAPDSIAPLLAPDAVRRHRLANGLTVLVRQDRSAPVVAVNTYVKAGYFDEPDRVTGIAHVLEHMFFKGTQARGVGEIARQTKAQGGYLNAHTIYDHTSYYAVLPASGFATGLEIQADAYAHSVIDAEELARELEVIIQEVKRKRDNPTALTIEGLYALLHDRHRIRRWRMGEEDALRQFTREEVVRFYRNHYRPSNTILVIVGDVDVDDALARAEALYGTLADAPVERDPGPVEDGPPGLRYRELDGDVRQAQAAMGWRSPGTHHDDTPRLELAAAVLGTGRGSRLYRAVRERSLARSVSAYDSTPTELGVFVVHVEGDPATLPDAARAAWREVDALRDDGVHAEELDRVRRIVDARGLRRLESMEGQANWLAEWEAQGGWELGERHRARLLTEEADAVTEAARRWLDPDQLGTVVFRPRGAPPVATDAPGWRAVLDASDVAPVAMTGALPAGAPAVVASRPTAERVEAGVHVFRTRRGVPLLVLPKPGLRIAHLGWQALGGASEEGDDEAGLTALMAQTALKGTTRRTAAQLAEAAELLGGSLGASVGGEAFGWGISVPTANLPAAAELLADVVQHPVFDEAAFEVERRAAELQLRELRDDMYRWPLRLAQEAAYDGHPYGRPVGGHEATLAALGAGRLRDWHAAAVREAAAVLAVVGDVDPVETAALVDAHFDALSMREGATLRAPTWRAGASRSDARDKAQTALALLFPGPARNDADRTAAQLLVGIASGLGGRFFDELRDRRSLAYTVQAFSAPRRLGGLLGAYIATSPEREAEAREGLLAEFARLVDAPVGDEELRRAQTYALGTHAIARQGGGALLGDLVDAWLLGDGLAELERFEARVREVTPARIQAMAARSLAAAHVEGIVRGTGGAAAG
ncbi:MAG TPA: pitrilysin family protein [Gemmatirosa sp.]|nr:pitrilysin family protein [Gemmatirosa sp.]